MPQPFSQLGNEQDRSCLKSSLQSTFTGSNASCSTLGDYDLLESLENQDHPIQNSLQNIYSSQSSAVDMSMDRHTQLNNVYSCTPDEDPIQSPFVYSFSHQQLQLQRQFLNYPQTPNCFVGSHNDNYDAGSRHYLYLTMQQKSSNTGNPLNPKAPGLGMQSLGLNETDPRIFSTIQPTGTSSIHLHEKKISETWDAQSASSLTSLLSSDISLPIQAQIPNPQIVETLTTSSPPPKLNSAKESAALAIRTEEVKRRGQRESHNLVERRRRYNINNRIQELSRLIPMHRLENEKVRKALQNNPPLSPTLGSTSMSLPHDKGPSKGDILDGAISWTRDLMWMLRVKLQQQEELANLIREFGGQYQFESTEEEQRMQTELMDAMYKNNFLEFSYSRAPRTGLRVPKHTDVKGDPTKDNASGTIKGGLAAQARSEWK